MTIKHLVIGGGGPGGIINYGIMKQAYKDNIWKYENIKSIYSSSMGSIMGLMILLNLDWEWIDDYIIKRPWNDLINISSHDYLNLLKDKGLISQNVISEVLNPLLKAVDLDIDITLLDLYNKFNKEFHCFTCNINTESVIELINISHKTHPNLLLVDAIFMTCTVPLLCKPICKDDKCYLDGGLLANVPIDECLKDTKCNLDEVLVAKYKRNIIPKKISNNTSVWTYLLDLFSAIGSKLLIECENKQNSNLLIIVGTMENNKLGSFQYWFEVINSQKERELLVEAGMNSFKVFAKENKNKILDSILMKNKEDKNKYLLYKKTNNILKRSISF